MRRLLASWFGSGLLLGKLRGSDVGSGTVGAALAFAIALLLRPLGWPIQLAAAAVVTILSILVTAPYSEEGDPGWVVVDEAAGTLIATVGLGIPAAVAAFIVFRIADIWKATPGVGQAERLPRGWGITLDDVVAGLYGLGAGWVVEALLA